MVACELGYDYPGVEGRIPNDAVYFVHFVFSFCLFEWLNRGLGADGAASARCFLGVGVFQGNSPNLKSRHSRAGGDLVRSVSVFSDRFLLRCVSGFPLLRE